jgi:hypothetical protein
MVTEVPNLINQVSGLKLMIFTSLPEGKSFRRQYLVKTLMDILKPGVAGKAS